MLAIPTIPLKLWWGQFTSKMLDFKWGEGLGLGEDIHNHVLSKTVSEVNFSFLNDPPNEVVIYINIFHVWMVLVISVSAIADFLSEKSVMEGRVDSKTCEMSKQSQIASFAA